MQLGRDKDAEAALLGSTQTIESIARRLTTPRLRQTFLTAEPVAEIYRTLGRWPPKP